MTTSTVTTPQADKTMIRQALAALFEPGDTIELRAFESRRCTLSGYYDDHDRAAEAAVKMNRSCSAVYVTVNQLSPDLLPRRANRFEKYAGTTTSDDPKQVIRRRWLPVDLDPQRPAEISSSDEEHDAAIQRARQIHEILVKDHGWPAPVAADSGNGSHLLWRINLPNDDESAALVQNCLTALDAKFTDEAVSVDTGNYNASRIWKLYGSVAKKGDHTGSRPHRLAKLLHVPESVEVVPGEKLRELAAMVPKTERPTRQQNDRQRSYSGNDKFDLPGWLREHGIEVLHDEPYRGQIGTGHRWVLEQCVWNPEHNDKSAFIIQLDSGKLAAGCQHNSCQGKGWPDLREAVEPGYRDRQREYSGQQYAHAESTGPAGSDAVRPVAFDLVSCLDLAAGDYAVNYLVRDVLAEGVPCMVGGQLKTLKTLLATALAISLATGRDFLGHFPVLQAARVVYFIGEGGLCVAQDYARRVASSLEMDLADIPALAFCDRVPQAASLPEMDAVVEALTGHEATVAFFDPLYLMLEARDSGNIMAMGPVFRTFTRACSQAGVTPAIVHHLKKNRATVNPLDPPELAELSWSGAAEYAGQWLLVGRQDRYDPDDPGRHSLWFNCGGRAGPGSRSQGRQTAGANGGGQEDVGRRARQVSRG